VEPNFAITACDKGWAEKLDLAAIDTDRLKPEMVTDCAIPVLEYAFTIGYNTEVFADDHPTSWAEFFDTEKFPGKRGFWKYATGAMFEAALLADGVAPEDLYPLDIDGPSPSSTPSRTRSSSTRRGSSSSSSSPAARRPWSRPGTAGSTPPPRRASRSPTSGTSTCCPTTS
jgi:spermidine/putrescine-binding protein